MKIKQRARDKFAYFSACEDTKRLPPIPYSPEGLSALECFHLHESVGGLPSQGCREPVLLSRALNGKEWHGVTVTTCAEDYVDRLLFASELKANYPEWVRRDILGRAAQIAMERVGYVPAFVRTGEDFTSLATMGEAIV